MSGSMSYSSAARTSRQDNAQVLHITHTQRSSVGTAQYERSSSHTQSTQMKPERSNARSTAIANAVALTTAQYAAHAIGYSGFGVDPSTIYGDWDYHLNSVEGGHFVDNSWTDPYGMVEDRYGGAMPNIMYSSSMGNTRTPEQSGDHTMGSNRYAIPEDSVYTSGSLGDSQRVYSSLHAGHASTSAYSNYHIPPPPSRYQH
ncbi:hypothetical protein M427DRAFT_65065 [Gonapodya prolifera JEL478]|uniref:Uncharacterized protein n=1 Tax=Gonapodya prolifera (strain JEL478) TaxID=1344416 RepID=A0A138ZWL1_GONPJ|nr:hypothetical protein M427DRAFT_65065 [Gonapodya prolifera JEL478]|eukprot:KXS08886.1 hypothetical protein M427DRAFT_65065 [Gonapodya prolifera JEL478]